MRYVTLVIVAAVLAMGSSVSAQDDEEKQLACASYEKLAADIMRARQNGASPSKLVEVFRSADANDALTRMSIAIVQDAYNRPRYATERNKAREVENFSASVYMACLEIGKE